MAENTDGDMQGLVNELAADMRANTTGKTFELTAVRATGTEFCDVWPAIREGLELLKAHVTKWWAKIAIGVVIKAGDSVCEPK